MNTSPNAPPRLDPGPLLAGAVLAMLTGLPVGALAQPAAGEASSSAREIVVAVMSPEGDAVLDRIGDDHLSSAEKAVTLDGDRIGAAGTASRRPRTGQLSGTPAAQNLEAFVRDRRLAPGGSPWTHLH